MPDALKSKSLLNKLLGTQAHGAALTGSKPGRYFWVPEGPLPALFKEHVQSWGKKLDLNVKDSSA